GHRAPARLAREREQAMDVVRAARALEAVQDEQQRRARGRRVQAIEVDEVTVGRGDPLAPGRDDAPAHERAPDGLRVAVSQPPRRAERYSCPLSSSFTTSGTISRARRSSSASVMLPIRSSSVSELNFVFSISATRLPASAAGRGAYAMTCVAAAVVGSRISMLIS